MHLQRIISGAQTGADRGALDAALANSFPCGGWVPRGRTAEDGVIPDSYSNLRECEESAPARRTELNVLEADATLILSHGPLHGGSAYTLELARQHGKPVLHIDLAAFDPDAALAIVRRWLASIEGSTLNVAGPRASHDPHIYDAARALIERVLEAS